MSRLTNLGFCLLFCFAFQACEDPTRLKNYHAGIIPMDSMQFLLAEVHIVESYRNRSYQQLGGDTVSFSRTKAMYEAVMEKHGLSVDRFLDSYAYYQQQHPMILDSLYEGVNQKLNEMLTDTYQ